MTQRTKIVLLWGQSNAKGLGAGADLSSEMAAPASAIQVWTGGEADASVLEQWLPLQTGLGADLLSFGPEMAAAQALQALWRCPVRVIKFGQGNTALAIHWQYPMGTCWVGATESLAAALAAIPAGEEYEIAGLIWRQGESDALDEDHADAYAVNVEVLIAIVRSALLLDIATLPVILVKPLTGGVYTYAATVRAAMDARAAADSLVATTDADSLPTVDGTHSDAVANWKIGLDAATALFNLAG